MKTDEAIQQINAIIAHGGISTDQWQALETAKTAIHEIAEREKGCEFCNLCNKGKSGTALGLEAIMKPEILPLISICLVEPGIKVTRLEPQFCPKCGRKLAKVPVTERSGE